MSFGSAGRGAVLALRSHGIRDITVFTRRPVFLVGDRIPGVRYEQVFMDRTGELVTEDAGGNAVPLIEMLDRADVLVNCILQDPNKPVIFIRNTDIMKFKKECLVIDISCDEGMGFEFATPTSFSHPFRRLGNILYYSVDHAPSLLWDSASWEISASLFPYIPDFVARKENPVLEDAIDIRNGIIQNKAILAFQKRSPVYPYCREKSLPLPAKRPVVGENMQVGIS